MHQILESRARSEADVIARMTIEDLLAERETLLEADHNDFDAARLADIDDALIEAIPMLLEQIKPLCRGQGECRHGRRIHCRSSLSVSQRS